MPTPKSNIGIIDLGFKTLVLNKFAPVMGIPVIDESIVMMPKGIALREVAEKRAKDKVGNKGFISFYPLSIGRDRARARTPAALVDVGVTTTYNSSNQSNVVTVQAVPAALNFELVFWSLSYDQILKAIEEYMFWPYNSPTLNMSFNATPLNFQLDFADALTDESTLREKYTQGIIFIYSCIVNLDGWLPRFNTDWTVETIYTTIYDANANPPIKIFAETDTIGSTVITYGP